MLCRTISTLELRHIMSNLADKLKKSDIDEMIFHSDVDGDGIIHCNEWVNLVKKNVSQNFKFFKIDVLAAES